MYLFGNDNDSEIFVIFRLGQDEKWQKDKKKKHHTRTLMIEQHEPH
jgi:hypothetical protein